MLENNEIHTIVLCLKSGGDFFFKDVDLLCFHLKTQHKLPLRIICLSDTIDQIFELKNVTLIPTPYKEWPGWWTKMNLFAPEMEQYRPFLYIDLDTAIVGPINSLFNKEELDIITLSDFYKKEEMASGIMWMPANSTDITHIWEAWMKNPEQHIKKYRGDQNFISNFIFSKKRWQDITNKICSFKVRENDKSWLQNITEEISVVCFHGHPRIKDAVSVRWVLLYMRCIVSMPKVSVIIPYKVDRGWLQQAINSVPDWAQVLVSKGKGTWPANFNKALPEVTGDFIRFLHDDDYLPEHSLEYSVEAIIDQQVDFVHGRATDFYEDGKEVLYDAPAVSAIKYNSVVTLQELLECNCVHGGSLVFRKKVFDKLKGFDETLKHAEEYDFVLHCLSVGFKMGFCEASTYYYRRHVAQKSNIENKELLSIGKKIATKYKAYVPKQSE